MRAKKVELLAPAGNMEGFYGALAAGADAVYLGGSKFGARAYAENFTEEELICCIRYAHVLGKKVYLTVNTLVKDSEWEDLDASVRPFYEAGLDGVIVQDIGVLLYIREHFPEMELHASTQMTLTGAYGADYVKKLGVCRIVPARELSLNEIKTLKEATGLEIEVFIHGAMCYCYSGQCLFSSLLGGRSGNRGRCAQPCRLPYSVSIPSAEGNNGRHPTQDLSVKNQPASGYPLSLKDLCTIELLPTLIEAGVDSLKIEGRMKKPEYAAGVTAVYRKYIDRYYARPESRQKIAPQDWEVLSGLYIRSGIQEGYYNKHNGKEMITPDGSAYRSGDEALLAQIRKQYLQKKPTLPVDIYAEFSCGKPAQVTFLFGDVSVTVTGETVPPARNQPVTEENIKKQLQKLGDTAFSPGETWITMDENAFYSLKALNELRRKAVHCLEERLILENGLCAGRKATESGTESGLGVKTAENSQGAEDSSEPGINVVLTTIEQFRAFQNLISAGYIPSRIYLESDLFAGKDASEAEKLTKEFARRAEVFLALPRILRTQDAPYLDKVLVIAGMEEISGCMVRSLEGYAYLEAHHYQKKIASDACFYIWNQRTLEYWGNKLDSFCLPYELNAREQRILLQGAEMSGCGYGKGMKQEAGHTPVHRFGQMKAEKVIYGYLPLMVTANCVVKTMGQCGVQPTEGIAFLTDRYQKRFPVTVNCKHCMNTIYNSVPLSLHSTCIKWRNIAQLRLDFTIETGREADDIFRFFYRLLDGNTDLGKTEKNALPFAEYTTAHEKRGVE